MDNLLPSGLENINPDKPLFSISIVSEALGVHARTLRIYDEEKILVPKRAARNKRLYSINDIEKGKFIQFLSRNIGLNLAGIKLFLCMMEELEIPISKGIDYITKRLSKLNITNKEQLENIEKHSKRGKRTRAVNED